MKKYLFLLFATAQVTVLFAQKSDETPYITKSFSEASIKKIEAQTSGGNISVESVSSNPHIEVYVRDNQGKVLSKDELAERLKNYDLTVDASSGKLTAKAESKERNMNWKKSLSISFKIYSLKAVSTDLSTSGGNITLNDLDGDQKFATSGGNLVLDKLSGDIDGSTSGGNISISHSNDNIELSTSGGNVDASDCSGKLNIATSGGNLHLNNLKGNIKAGTSGGNIHGDNIEGSLSTHTSGGNINLDHIAATLETGTSGGSISINIIKLGDYVRVSNSGGNIDLQLPKGQGLDLHLEGDKVKTTSLTNFSGSVEDDKVDGKMNGGGTSVVVKTSGRVNVSLQ